MRERTETILKSTCLVLAALLLVQLVRAGFRVNPLHGAVIPALPALPQGSNTLAGATNASGVVSSNKGTNAATRSALTHSTGTNQAEGSNAVVSSAKALRPGAAATNLASATNAQVVVATGTTARLETNSSLSGKLNGALTNVALEPISNASPPVIAAGTNGLPANKLVSRETNASGALAKSGTNLLAKTNLVSSASANKAGSIGTVPGEKKAPELPPDIRARIVRITDSEFLGQVIRPQPMALLGIAGDYAFLRAPSGQTGLVKTGDSLGEIKLIAIGINRVLVERDGQKSELTIFSGMGGESLINTGNTNETDLKQRQPSKS